MSEVDDQYVKRGFWINWSQGFVLGGTLTVDSRSGNAVVALLTICASIGTAQLFHLFAFFYHQWRAKGRASDGLYWQQQALLRTFPTPTTLVAEYFKLWWSWRNKVNHGKRPNFLDITSSRLKIWKTFQRLELEPEEQEPNYVCSFWSLPSLFLHMMVPFR